ncbi:helix-turn-helix domain-containing protein [Rhizobium halophytocola]|uniref:helix-turn-helix domain-containing protein n=1 Tax=Rhizobium halophytocola TaxID=735519 RepID=UPI00360F6EDF
MNMMVGTSLHMGPEMDRAINRTDFFRLFKAVTRAYGFDVFLLFRHPDRLLGLRPHHDFLLTDLPEELFATTALALAGGAKEVLGSLSSTTMPFIHDLPSDLIAPGATRGWQKAGSQIVVLPMHAPDSKRYCLLFGGLRDMPDRREIADLLLDGLRIFNKYYARLLSQETSPSLTARETEVVRWTSEGKTSAEIAIILGLSEHTVISHVTAAARKLNAVNRAHLIAIAVKRGLVG